MTNETLQYVSAAALMLSVVGIINPRATFVATAILSAAALLLGVLFHE